MTAKGSTRKAGKGAAGEAGKGAAREVTKHILVVDDDRLVRVTVALGLRQAGYQVSEAEDAPSALEAVRQSEFALAILDARMPNGSGVELARRLDAEFGLPFIFLSAYDDAEAVREAAAAGALGYLVKPVDVRQMIPTIEAALDRGAEIKALRTNRAQLSTALEQGRETSVAIGILMQRYQLDEEEAFDALRAYARSHRRKLAEVAAELVTGVSATNRLSTAIIRARRA